MVNPDIRFNIPPARTGGSGGPSKPEGEPSGSKNFEKVMKRDDRGSGGQQKDDDNIKQKKGPEGEQDDAELGDAESKPKEKPASIFDMSRATKPPVVKPEVVAEPPSEELLVEMAENKQLSGKDKKNPEELPKQPPVATTGKTQPQHPTLESKNTDAENISGASSRESEVSVKDAKDKDRSSNTFGNDKKASREEVPRSDFDLASQKASKSKDKISTDPSRARDDNLLAQAQHQQPLVNPMGEAKAAEAPRNTSQMKELIDQIVKEMYVVKTGDTTDTVMTIRHPPMFEGAQVKITSFESARGEFNIAFENLSQQAKDLLDSRLNRDSLLLALNKEGYNVHIMTTSTTAAAPLYTAQTEQRDQEKEQQGQGQQEQQKEKEQQKKKG